MSGNPHYVNADELLAPERAGGPAYIDPQTSSLMLAAVEAQLAVAWEQRTANLIAWVAAHGEDPSWVTVEIQQRLGL